MPNTGKSSASFDEISSQFFQPNKWVDFVFGIDGLFAVIETGDLCRVVGDVKVTIFIAVVYAAIATVNL